MLIKLDRRLAHGRIGRADVMSKSDNKHKPLRNALIGTLMSMKTDMSSLDDVVSTLERRLDEIHRRIDQLEERVRELEDLVSRISGG